MTCTCPTRSAPTPADARQRAACPMTSPRDAADLLAVADFAEGVDACEGCGEVDRCSRGCPVGDPDNYLETA